MSIFSKIIAAEHTFAAWAEKELEKLYSVTPKVEAVAAAVLKYAGPALQLVVTAEAGSAAGSLVGAVISEAQTDLIAASSLIYDFGANPTATSIINAVLKNLAALLTAGHITNAGSVSTVTKVLSSLGALAAALPVVAPVAAPEPAPVA